MFFFSLSLSLSSLPTLTKWVFCSSHYGLLKEKTGLSANLSCSLQTVPRGRRMCGWSLSGQAQGLCRRFSMRRPRAQMRRRDRILCLLFKNRSVAPVPVTRFYSIQYRMLTLVASQTVRPCAPTSADRPTTVTYHAQTMLPVDRMPFVSTSAAVTLALPARPRVLVRFPRPRCSAKMLVLRSLWRPRLCSIPLWLHSRIDAGYDLRGTGERTEIGIRGGGPSPPDLDT